MTNEIHELKVKTNENLLKFELIDEKGNHTGEYLKFDLEDMNCVLRYQECLEEHKKNAEYIRNQQLIISKQQDHKGKKILSSNEEKMQKALVEYYDREIKALDKFLGEGKTRVILKIMDREPYLSMFEDINDMLNEIMPYIEKSYENIKKKIVGKYKDEPNILE